MIYLKGALLLASLGLVLTGAWCLAGAVDSIWNAWLAKKRRDTAERMMWAQYRRRWPYDGL